LALLPGGTPSGKQVASKWQASGKQVVVQPTALLKLLLEEALLLLVRVQSVFERLKHAAIEA
jgi:hypothetical protein